MPGTCFLHAGTTTRYAPTPCPVPAYGMLVPGGACEDRLMVVTAGQWRVASAKVFLFRFPPCSLPISPFFSPFVWRGGSCASGLRVQAFGFRVWRLALGFGVWGIGVGLLPKGSRVEGRGSRVEGRGSRV
eukprot:308414-Rhodomonas_salina.1